MNFDCVTFALATLLTSLDSRLVAVYAPFCQVACLWQTKVYTLSKVNTVGSPRVNARFCSHLFLSKMMVVVLIARVAVVGALCEGGFATLETPTSMNSSNEISMISVSMPYKRLHSTHSPIGSMGDLSHPLFSCISPCTLDQRCQCCGEFAHIACCGHVHARVQTAPFGALGRVWTDRPPCSYPQDPLT